MKKLDAVADAGLHHPRGRLLKELKKYGPIKGFVVGAFSELSSDLKALAAALVDAKVPGDPRLNQAARSWAWNYVRTALGVAAARTNARIKLDGLRWCGPGGKEAYSRRREARQAAQVRADTARAMYNAVHYVTHQAHHCR